MQTVVFYTSVHATFQKIKKVILGSKYLEFHAKLLIISSNLLDQKQLVRKN